MPSARIRLDVDPATRKRTIVIGYESDSDALPYEHEEAHRALLDKLFEKGILKEGDSVRVERENEGATTDETKKEESVSREGVKQGS